MEGNKSRGQWGSNFGFLMAAIGSAVGLGNIWGFPYKMGANGGFAFLLLYLVLVALVGFAVMLGELALGRKTGKGAVATYVELSKKFKWLGWLGFFSAFLIMAFYSVLGGYCIKYMVANFSDIFNLGFGFNNMSGGILFGSWLNAENFAMTSEMLHSGNFFVAFLFNYWEAIFYTVIFMVITCVIVMGGIAGGIEKFSKVAMPALFVMLLVVIVRSVTLPGAMEGVKFMFNPNFEPLQKNFLGVLSTAGGQMFFSLSLGMGCMITYGSYLSKKENLEKNAVIIPIADTVIAILAGLAVMPAAFALGGAEAAKAGPKLLFITLQTVFDAMGAAGPFFGFLFYLLVVIAAITSAISLVEVASTFFVDRAVLKGQVPNRKKSALIVSLGIMVFATIVAYDALGTNLPLLNGGKWAYIDLFDCLSEGIMMPLGALFMALFIGYEYGIKKFGDEIRENGNAFKSEAFFSFSIKIIVPIAMLFILLGQLMEFGLIPKWF